MLFFEVHVPQFVRGSPSLQRTQLQIALWQWLMPSCCYGYVKERAAMGM
jgi:hypothetical protein